MNFIKRSLFKPFILVLFFTLAGPGISCAQSFNTQPENAIVVLKFKTQPDKGAAAVAELKKLIEKVKHEPHFVSIKIHVDPEDKTNIMLYEEWEDLSYYRTSHMTTEHLEKFKANSVNFLAGPPEISFWTVEKEFRN